MGNQQIIFNPQFAERTHLPKDNRVQNTEIGGACWITSRVGVNSGHVIAFQAAIRQVQGCLPAYRLWIVACNSAWQVNNSIAHYRKLWSSLEFQGLKIPSGRRIDERMQSGSDGVRWFAAAEILDGELEDAVAILETEPCSHLVAVQQSEETILTNLVELGWNQAVHGPSPEVLRSILDVDGIVFWPVGSFDDIESGVVAFARPDVIDRITTP